jgi:hypothetical protein
VQHESHAALDLLDLAVFAQAAGYLRRTMPTRKVAEITVKWGAWQLRRGLDCAAAAKLRWPAAYMGFL